MTASKRVYWLGEMIGKRRIGGIKVDGKHISIGESFAADKLDKDRLSAFRKAGCIGDAPFLVSEPVGNDLDLLKGRIVEMENVAVEQAGIINDLKKKVAPASGDVTELKKKVVELESEVKRLTDEAKDAADIKADHVKAHVNKAAAAKTKKKGKKK